VDYNNSASRLTTKGLV